MHQRLKITQNMVSVGVIGEKATRCIRWHKSHSFLLQIARNVSDKTTTKRVSWQGNKWTKLVVSGVV